MAGKNGEQTTICIVAFGSYMAVKNEDKWRGKDINE